MKLKILLLAIILFSLFPSNAYADIQLILETVTEVRGVGTMLLFKITGVQQTVTINITNEDNGFVENLSFVASQQGEINLPWIIPQSMEPGIYVINISDDFNLFVTSFDHPIDPEHIPEFEHIPELEPIEPPTEPIPVITIDELQLLITTNTDMMDSMYEHFELLETQNTHLESLITSLTDIINSLQGEIIIIHTLLEDKEIPLPQTLPIFDNIAYSSINSTIHLSWNVVSGDPIVKYVFKWRDEPGTSWTKDIVRIETLTSWEISGLENHEYEFAFFATNAVGNSEIQYFTLTP